MKPVNKIQVILISGAILLIVLLLFADTKPREKSKPAEVEPNSIDLIVESVKQGLQTEQQQQLEKLEEQLNSNTNKNQALTDLVNYWSGEINQPIGAAYYAEQLAIITNDEKSWADVANRYWIAARFAQAPSKAIVFKKAISSFEKVIEKNPSNTDAKINLASCYVEEGSQPMKGIGMLKEIEKTDSNNVNLQLNFAYFSQQSGQFDKAITRFEKILKINPEFTEAYIHIAGAYEQMGDKQKAIEYLKKYQETTTDNAIKQEVQKYIEKLSN